MAEQTLTEALAVIGIRHERSKTVDKRDWFDIRTGEHLGCYDAHEGWKKLGEITSAKAA